MIYLHFIEPGRVIVPVTKEALIFREKFDVVVMTDEGRVFPIGPDPTVSGNHARIYLYMGKCYIQDLGSLNGTRINGKLITGWEKRKASQPVELDTGSVVEVGVYTRFIVELTTERPREDKCSTILQINRYVVEAVNKILRVKLGEEKITSLVQDLDYLVSRDIYLRVLEEISRDSISILKQHLGIMKKDPHGYSQDMGLLDELDKLLQGIISNIDREYVLCMSKI